MLNSIQEGMSSDSYSTLTDHIVYTSEHKSQPYLPNNELSTIVECESRINDSAIIIGITMLVIVAIIATALIVKRQRVMSWFRNGKRREVEVDGETRNEKNEAISETTVGQTAHISLAEQETWHSHPSEDIYDDESVESFDGWESKGVNDGSGCDDVISAVPFNILPSDQINEDTYKLNGDEDLEQLKTNDRGENFQDYMQRMDETKRTNEQIHQQKLIDESDRDKESFDQYENEHPPAMQRELNKENAENDVNLQIDENNETSSLSENGGVNFVLVNTSTDSSDNDNV